MQENSVLTTKINSLESSAIRRDAYVALIVSRIKLLETSVDSHRRHCNNTKSSTNALDAPSTSKNIPIVTEKFAMDVELGSNNENLPISTDTNDPSIVDPSSFHQPNFTARNSTPINFDGSSTFIDDQILEPCESCLEAEKVLGACRVKVVRDEKSERLAQALLKKSKPNIKSSTVTSLSNVALKKCASATPRMKSVVRGRRYVIVADDSKCPSTSMQESFCNPRTFRDPSFGYPSCSTRESVTMIFSLF